MTRTLDYTKQEQEFSRKNDWVQRRGSCKGLTTWGFISFQFLSFVIDEVKKSKTILERKKKLGWWAKESWKYMTNKIKAYVNVCKQEDKRTMHLFIYLIIPLYSVHVLENWIFSLYFSSDFNIILWWPSYACNLNLYLHFL